MLIEQIINKSILTLQIMSQKEINLNNATYE